MKVLVLACVALVYLSGCATLSQEDCVRGNWLDIGYNDGHNGETTSRINEHQKACSEYGIRIDMQKYSAGREQGLVEYCKLDNAFTTGLEGHEYQYVCPAAIDSLFRRYNSAAYTVYQDRSELTRIDNELSSKESKLSSKKLSDSDRSRIHSEIRSLDRNRDNLRDKLYNHERQLDDLRNEARYRR